MRTIEQFNRIAIQWCVHEHSTFRLQPSSLSLFHMNEQINSNTFLLCLPSVCLSAMISGITRQEDRRWRCTSGLPVGCLILLLQTSYKDLMSFLYLSFYSFHSIWRHKSTIFIHFNQFIIFLYFYRCLFVVLICFL